ncbi:MAG: hypothetical protein SLAVMIC_00773 [uncultured marine phage]|uniref:Uncharacterized protein n=1 Tax=uncultured marine phage TaxID=707152 RepID=A0A8D9C9H6_9VIRU|nr:MAG: hypothetical protein SLAVMIC_00773 [uncultured marine phage]
MIKNFNEYNKINEDHSMNGEELNQLKDWITHEIVSGVSDQEIADEAGAYAYNTVDLIAIIRGLLELDKS